MVVRCILIELVSGKFFFHRRGGEVRFLENGSADFQHDGAVV